MFCRSSHLRLRNFALTSLIAIAIGVVAAPERAAAVDLFGYTGMLDRSPVNGCCKKIPATQGFGLISRIENVGLLGHIEIGGFTDFKWSEMTLAKYQYLIGNAPQVDPVSTKDAQVKRLTDFSLSWSYGVGFFTHNTRTVAYDLPVLTTGGLIFTRLLYVYNINDVWAFGALINFSVGASALDTNFNSGAGLGLGYRF